MNKFEQLISSLNLNIDPTYDGEVLTGKMHYKGNRGFFHLQSDKFSVLLLKSIHKDFVRILEGELDLDQRTLSKISDFIANIEKNYDTPLIVKFFLRNDEIFIKDLQEEKIDPSETVELFEIPYPLTKVEYNLFKDSSDKNLYTKTIFSGYLPETATYFTNSIIKRLPDIFNPLFMYSNFKTYSPSIKTVFNKPYLNLNNINIWSTTLDIDNFYFNLNYAQYLYLKENYKKILQPKMKLLNLEHKEFTDIVKELEETIDKLDEVFLLSDEFNNFISLYVMALEMLHLFLMEKFLELYSIVHDLNLTLKMIYQTRVKSPVNNNTIKIYKHFDIDTDFKTITFEEIPSKDIKDFINRLPIIKKFLNEKKITTTTVQIHNYLNFRDRLFLFTQKLVEKIKDATEKLAEELISNMQIKMKEDIYFLELDEIKQIKDNNFYGNIAFNLYFRRAQWDRFKIQQTPSEIYEKDIDNVEEITKKIYEKARSVNNFKALTFFYKPDIKTYFILEKPSLYYLEKFKDKDAVIAQIIPIFSHLMEYLTLHEKTIYTGIKLPAISLKNKKLSFKDGEVSVEH